MQSRWILLLALLIAVGLYWSGLSGPFIFDDEWNLAPVRLWHAGQESLYQAIFPQASLVFSRPVAMGSFVLTTWLFGVDTFSFKLGNLIVHLTCGVLIWAVLRRLITRDSRLARHAELLAAMVAAIWLVHPLHVSTVLYAVQRMAQLGALFTLAAVWCYLTGRQQLIEGQTRKAWFNLFFMFPLMVFLGLLSKQNAAVGPALCLVLEIAYFNKQSRPGRSVWVFFSAFLAIPLAGVGALLALAPHKLLAGYDEWNFTIWERLLTQSRVLMDYVGMLLVPRSPLMGLYTDDFVTSHGLLSPPSTLFSLLALVVISLFAVAVRKRAPCVFAGWFFFLVAHSVESSFLPLEMYYEHRNYLPAAGLFLAVFGLIAIVPEFRTNQVSPRKLGLLAWGGFALVLCIATLGRVMVWKDLGSIAQLGVQTHPESLRARFDVSVWALLRNDYKTALDAMEYLAASNDPNHRQSGSLGIVVINCMRGKEEDSAERLRYASSAPITRLTTFEAQNFARLAGVTQKNGCGKLARSEIAANLARILDATPSQPESAAPKWFARFALADIYMRDDQWVAAQSQAEKSWRGSHNIKVGFSLANVYIHNGELSSAASLISQLQKMVSPEDRTGQIDLLNLSKMLAEKHQATFQGPDPASRDGVHRDDNAYRDRTTPRTEASDANE